MHKYKKKSKYLHHVFVPHYNSSVVRTQEYSIGEPSQGHWFKSGTKSIFHFLLFLPRVNNGRVYPFFKTVP